MTDIFDADTLLPITHFAPFADGLDHPEGVTVGPDGTVYAGGEAGQIYRVALDGTWQQIALFEFDTRPRQRELVVQLIGE